MFEERGTEYNGDIISLSLNPSSVLSKILRNTTVKEREEREEKKSSDILERISREKKTSRARINRIRSANNRWKACGRHRTRITNDPWRAWNRIESHLIDRRGCATLLLFCGCANILRMYARLFLLCVRRICACVSSWEQVDEEWSRERERERKRKRVRERERKKGRAWSIAWKGSTFFWFLVKRAFLAIRRFLFLFVFDDDHARDRRYLSSVRKFMKAA